MVSTKADAIQEKMTCGQEEKSLHIEEQEGWEEEEGPRIVEEESKEEKGQTLCSDKEQEERDLTGMQLPKDSVAGGKVLLNQEERDLELALRLQEQEVEERRAWVVELAGGGQHHQR